MSVIPKITCRRCGREYSGLRSRCPYCGTSRSRSAERIPLRTSSENAGTPAAEHAAVNTKWQMLFGGIFMVDDTGLEPVTLRTSSGCSYQLS